MTEIENLVNKAVVIIPARGGSKSIPRKNIQLINGRPMINFSIEYALNSFPSGNVIVSTDCPEIAEVARGAGAYVPFLRPKSLATDEAQDYGFMRHALDFLESKGRVYEYFVLLRPTSPLRSSGLIEKAVEIMDGHLSATSARTVASCGEHPYRMWLRNEAGQIEGMVKDEVEPYNIPRQHLPEILFQTGDLEIVRRSTLLAGSVSGDCVFPIEISHEQMVDIDTWDDLARVEAKVQS